jgi:hypothetical protein
MVNFNTSDEAPVNKQKLNYRYDNYTLYNSDLSTVTDSKNLSYIKFPYLNSPNSVYVSMINNNNYWTTTNAYVTGVVHHNITDITDDNQMCGELIIEHLPVSNDNGSKLYVCFFLQEDAGAGATATNNDIDNIINWPKSSNTNVASFNIALSVINNSPPPSPTGGTGTAQTRPTIPTQNNYIFYNDTITNNAVLIYLDPILIKSGNARLVEAYSSSPPTDKNGNPLFSITPPNDTIIGQNPLNSDNSDIYIDCQPTGVSDEEIKTYSLPINSEMTNSMGKLDFMKTTVNFFVFVILIGLVYFTMPNLYYSIVIDIVSKQQELSGNKDKCIRIRSIDYFLSFLFGLTILICFFKGFSSEQTELLSTGLFLFVIYILSFVLIQNKKVSEWEKETHCIHEGDSVNFDFTDFAMFLGEGFNYLLRKVSQFYFAIMLVLIVLVSIPLLTGSMTNKSASYILTICSIVMLPVSTVIKLMIDKK